SDPQGVIYEDKLKRKRLMRTDELYKFSDGTLNSVRNTLQQMLLNFRLRYNKAMERRKWTVSDHKRTRIMIKAIGQQLLERRIMRSLEKFVGGRDYGTDIRLLQRTVIFRSTHSGHVSKNKSCKYVIYVLCSVY
ncbi:hypothetical protein Tco_0193473, partial [Tanacetum coccineum]